MYADKRNTVRKPRSFKPGDIVLMKQTKENKLLPAYNPNPTKVVKSVVLW